MRHPSDVFNVTISVTAKNHFAATSIYSAKLNFQLDL